MPPTTLPSSSPPRKAPRRSAFHARTSNAGHANEDEVLIVVRVGGQTVHVLEADAPALARHCALIRAALASDPVPSSSSTTTYNNELVQRVCVTNPVVESADVVSVVRLCEVLAGVRPASELEHMHVSVGTVTAAYAMGANGAAVLASALLHGAPPSSYLILVCLKRKTKATPRSSPT